MNEMLVSVPQEVLYDSLRRALVTGKVNVVRKIEEALKPSFIKAKISSTFVSILGFHGYVEVRILPQNGGSKLRFSFSFKGSLAKFLLADTFILALLIGMLRFIPPQAFEGLAMLTLVIGLIGPIYAVPYTRNRFMEDIRTIIHNIETEYESVTTTKYVEIHKLLPRVRQLYKKLLNKHSELFLNYKIREYKMHGLNLEEAIKKLAEEEGIT